MNWINSLIKTIKSGKLLLLILLLLMELFAYFERFIFSPIYWLWENNIMRKSVRLKRSKEFNNIRKLAGIKNEKK